MISDYISFDIFDTCLTRSVAYPTDVFRLMAPNIAELAGVLISQRWCEDFVWARVRGESLARSRNPSGEIDLSAIWKIVKAILNLPENDYEAIELAWEDRVSVAIPSAKREVQAARSAGAKILFLSDMYLPSSFINSLLKKHEFFQNGDFLFVSCDYNATKASGRLFPLVVERLATSPERILHIGDNPSSDFHNAITAGWRARLVRWPDLTPVEMRLRRCNVLNVTKSSQLASAMRLSRLEGSDLSGDLCSQFVTPFLQVFVDWVLSSAEADGIERLYFLGRDCQLAWQFANHKALRRDAIDCRYLHASRRAYYPATIKEVSPDGIPWLCQPWEQPILVRLLDKLEISKREFSVGWDRTAPGKSLPHELQDKADWNRFWATLQQQPVADLILATAADRRAMLLGYLRQEGLMDGAKSAFVDIGWTYGIQRAAALVLREAGAGVPLRGYYLGSTFERWHDVHAKSLFQPSLPGTIDGSYEGELDGRGNFLEHILGLATHGSLTRFERDTDRVVAVFGDETGTSDFEMAGILQSTAIAKLEYFSDLKGLFSIDLDARAALSNLLREVHENPPKALAEGVRDIMVSGDANGHGARAMAAPYTWDELLRSVFRHGLKARPYHQRTREWLAGSLALTPRPLRRLARRLGL